MDATIFMAWLSSKEGDGGWWTDEQRRDGHSRTWSKAAPIHLSFHTSREGALAALTDAAHTEWDREGCSYAHGPWGQDDATDEQMVAYMVRHVGYEAHVTEQTVHLDTPDPVAVSGVTATVAHQVDWFDAAMREQEAAGIPNLDNVGGEPATS